MNNAPFDPDHDVPGIDDRRDARDVDKNGGSR